MANHTISPTPEPVTGGDPRDEDAALCNISDITWAEAPVFVIFWVMLIVVFLQFFTRYVLGNSLGWTEEIARYLLILLGFVGSIACSRKGTHIYLEFFHRFLPARVSRMVFVAMDVLTAAFFGFACTLGVELAERTADESMVSLDIPKGVLFWAVTVALGFSAAAVLLRLLRRVREA